VHQVELEMQNEELRTMQERLAASLARSTELFDFAPIGYVVTDAVGMIRTLNLAAARLLGAERRRGANMWLRLFVREAQRDELTEALTRVINRSASEPTAESLELTLVTYRGETREARLTMASMGDPKASVLVAIEDITARKSAEALRTQQHVQQQVLEATRWELDAARRLHEIGMLFLPEGSPIDVVFDKIVEAAIALSEADCGDIQVADRSSGLVEVRAQRGFASRDHGDGIRARGVAIARGERVIIEDTEDSELDIGAEIVEIKRRTGVRAVVATPLTTRSGRAIGTITIYFNKPHRPDDRVLRWIDLLARQAVDLIDRANAEDNEAMLRRRFEALDRLSVLLSQYVAEHRGEPFSDDLLAQVAELARSVTGADCAAVAFADDFEHWVVSPGSDARVIDRLRPAARDLARAALGERSVRHREAELTVLASAIRDHARPAGCLCVARQHDFDQDDRVTIEMMAGRLGVGVASVRLTRETLQAIQAHKTLLAVVSHDLRNPLATIRLSAGLMKRGGDDHQAQIILRAADRMMGLIEDLLQAAVIEAGRFKVDVSRQDVVPILREALEAFAPLAADKSIRLELDVPDVVPPVLGDRQRVAQVLANLLGNAIKFVDEGGRVLVRAWGAGNEVRVAVSDNGPGIAQEQLARVFERYEHGKTGGGVGLGLYIAKGIVEAHRGRIWVESQAGAGTTFYFAIPAAEKLALNALHP
jgi:PAS domain S-box-containing protein